MMLNRAIISFLIVLFSCTDNKVKYKYYQSGEVHYKEYYTEDKIDSIEEYSENTGNLISKFIDFNNQSRKAFYFDESNSADVSGVEILKGGKYIRNGWWIEHNNGYTLRAEYLSIGDTVEIKNQTIIIDSLGNIKNNFSKFYTIKNLPDTIESNKEYTFIIELTTPIKGNKDLYSGVLKLSDEISPDFLNYWTAKNTYNVKEKAVNKWEIKHAFNQKGLFHIRGCILNHMVEIEDISKDRIRVINTPDITYINKEVFIK